MGLLGPSFAPSNAVLNDTDRGVEGVLIKSATDINLRATAGILEMGLFKIIFTN